MEKITVYTTKTCPYCHQVMDWLTAKNLPYEEINAEGMNDIEIVPETHIGTDTIIGFNERKLLKSLRKYGYEV